MKLLLLCDTAVLGEERDVRQFAPSAARNRYCLDGIRNPSWTWDFITNEPIRFANVVGKSADDGSSAISLTDHVNAQFSQSLSWDDIEWF